MVRIAANLQALLVLAACLTLLLVVPRPWLRPLSVGFVAFAVLVVIGARAYPSRLEGAARFLFSNVTSPPAPLLVALLTAPERTLLRLDPEGTATEVISVLRQRQAALRSAAMCVAVPGICAFVLALFLFSD